VILASRSPQRRAILEQLGLGFTVVPTDVEEIEQGEPQAVALENALRKARALERPPGELIVGCDTLVALGGTIYGKASDPESARATLRALSGARHTVHSGLALIDDDGERCGLASTDVTFAPLSEERIDWYLASGEWRDRAGCYAIQGHGAALVAAIDGDYTNVVGLPVGLLLELAPHLLAAGA
jgi:septum formation protein